MPKMIEEEKKERKKVVGLGAGGSTLLLTIRAAERKTESEAGLKERGIDAGYSFTATERKARGGGG